ATILLFAANNLAFGEETVVFVQNDSIVWFENDSVSNDSTIFVLNDSTDFILDEGVDSVENSHLAPRSPSAIDSRVDFKAKDSIFFDLRINKVHLFEKAEVNYDDIELTAAKIEIHFDRDELSAFPKLDSLGNEVDRPFFKDPKQMFEARELTYNLVTKKARIKNIVTQDGEMIIHGDLVKKLPNNESFVQRARFTTCDLEHPHFHIVAHRAKIIPNNKVVTSGAMIFLNDVPTPLAVPFGLFPNKTNRASGILIPTYGESHNQNQGFFLRNGGFYWATNDYMDWAISGDIYSRGEWALRNKVQYIKRYKYNGNLNIETGMVPSGERGVLGGLSEFSMTRSMRVGWNHSQDPKANQNSTFSASVNYFNQASQKYSSDISAHLNNQSTSNIAYQLRGKRFQFSTTGNMNYNMASGDITLVLPTINFSMQPIYPFQRKVRQGNPQWYESFKITYSMNAKNEVSGNDSAFWNQDMLKNMKNGARHNIPMDVNIKVLGGKITWSHGVRYTEHWNFKATIRENIDTVMLLQIYDEDGGFFYDTTVIRRATVIDEKYGFFATRSYGYSTSFSTQLFGMAQFKRGPIKAFRHVMNPSIGFSYSPDFNTYENGWREYLDASGNPRRYNIFAGGQGGHPSGDLSGSINFSLGNNFEMKVRDKKDTVRGERKIKLLDQLNLSTSYNLAADSLNWSAVSLTANTTLFKNLRISYRASFDLYARDTTGGRTTRINKFIWQTDDKFLLRESESMSTGLSYTFNSKNREKNSEQNRMGTSEIFEHPATFGPQWSLSVSYNVSYGSRYSPGYHRNDIWGRPILDDERVWNDYDRRITQGLTFNGNLDLTDKWKISFSSGWDFVNKEISQTMFNITRDLHCWTMSFTWAPFGMYREWSFNIQLLSNMLGDVMKYDRKRTNREFDNYF
ncbi:MAG: hypothetical protein LBP96_04170, partial [Bacteroidales bacterium]|nr:hypothetical protein [Bacteroidales bacterium]